MFTLKNYGCDMQSIFIMALCVFLWTVGRSDGILLWLFMFNIIVNKATTFSGSMVIIEELEYGQEEERMKFLLEA